MSQEAKVYSLGDGPTELAVREIQYKVDEGSMLMLDFGPMFGLAVNATKRNFNRESGQMETLPNESGIRQLISGKLATSQETKPENYSQDYQEYNKRVSHILTLDEAKKACVYHDFFNDLSDKLLYGVMWRMSLAPECQQKPEYDINACLASEQGIQFVIFAPQNPLSKVCENLHIVGSSANAKGTPVITEFEQAKTFADQLNRVGKPCALVNLENKEKYRIREGSFPIFNILSDQPKKVSLVRSCDQLEKVMAELSAHQIQVSS